MRDEKDFKQRMAAELNLLVHTKVIGDEIFLLVFAMASAAFDNWKEEFAEDLKEEAKNWEQTDDSGLYSLALRRTVDKLLRKKFQDELPILEKKTTLTEDEFLADVIKLRDEGDDNGEVR